MKANPPQLTGFDLVEAFHLSHAVATLHVEGVFGLLSRPSTVREIAAELGLDPRVLRPLLDYVSIRTDLLQRAGDSYIATAMYNRHCRFEFDQYILTYGPNARALSSVLRNASAGADLADAASHARAFLGLGGPSMPFLADALECLEVSSLLDLGCGTASLLCELARRRPAFTGWGVDSNPEMCRAAMREIERVGCGDRVRVIHGDCRELAATAEAVAAHIDAISIASVMNEFVLEPSAAVAWLGQLRGWFAGKLAVVADYYGQLNTAGPYAQSVLLHDFVQVISAQGIPPSAAPAWRELYEGAGCQVIQIAEDSEHSAFVHILRL